jgi:methylmalonyl-CoA/ethylmalonyl-CoA epimerase
MATSFDVREKDESARRIRPARDPRPGVGRGGADATRSCEVPGYVSVFTRIDHVGVAVRDLEASISWYESTFGLTVVTRETHEDQGVNEAMLIVADGPSGGSYVQLLEPTREDSPVGKFLAAKGEGVHHIGYGVDDVEQALADIGGAGVRLVDARPRHGSMGASIAFLHPKDTGGVLTELVQAAAR